MADERLGASFSIDVSQLQTGLKTANKLIRESQSEFKAAAAGMDDWRKSEEGLTARNQALTQQMKIQQTKVDALKQNYQNLINQGLDPTSDRAIQLRTQINNEEAALNKCKTEINQNTTALENLGDESEEAGKDAKKGSEGFTVLKGVLANLATEGIKMALNGLKNLGAAAINLGKSAIESYADYEQLVGGVETLFGAGGQSLEEYAKSVGKSVSDAKGEYDKLMLAQDTMIKNANDAYKNAGMSANDYMSNVTSFSAALISSLGGDTVAAANQADMAMQDISDNANKMGTDMQSIVDTYQSLSRGNFQMLDNLKLGYGGTKSEMERLIADANAVKKANGEMADLSIDSFADMTEAIHIIQDEMGITGTTANEAEGTISGSIGMMKASWQNLLTGMADNTMDFDQLITNFIDSVQAVASNLVPRITVVMQGIIKLIQGLLPQIPPLLADILPQLVVGIKDLANGIADILPDVISILMNDVLPLLLTSIIELLPTLLSTCISLVSSIVTGLSQMFPSVVSALIEIVPLLTTELVSQLPSLLQASIILLMAVVQAIPVICQKLIPQLPMIINTITNVLIQNLGIILNAGVQVFTAIVQAIPVVIPQIVKAIPSIISSIFNALTSPEAISSIAQAGKDLIKGLWNGISDMASWIGEKIKGFGKGVLDNLKSFFGIHSPSKVMENVIGKNLALGIGKGFDKNIGKVNDKIQNAMNFDDPSINVNASGVRGFGRSVVVNQYNNYSQQHSRYEIYKSKQQTAAAVRLAMGTV
jgi:phage-related protein